MIFITTVNLSSIDTNLFMVFHAVLEERSATLAAKRLSVTQSAVSNALARLRDVLGDPLFVRSGRGLVPTPRAAELAPFVARAVEQLEAALDLGRAFVPAECARTFTFAAADNHQTSEAPRIAAAVSRALPKASLRMVSADYLASGDGLSSGEIDLALVPSMLVQPGHHGTKLFTEHACLVVRRGHPHASGRMTPAVFSELGHIDVEVALGKPGVGHREAERHWKGEGLVRRVAITVPYFTTAALMASRTDYVAGLPSRVANVLVKILPIRIVRTTFPMPAIAVSMMWHERAHRDAAAVFFRRVVASATKAA